ncbi:MAG: sodium:solute symporter family protein [Deltaproteobacteria bacterium]|nr:sodium:solute symporter family protein [Deltaproteobacteria bacterium]
MDLREMAWMAIGLYVLVTAVLAYRGWKKTKSLESFAIGGGDIAPWIVGLSLAAQLTSVATFVVNPGLVFAYGLSGLLGFGVAAGAGIILGLVLFSKAFRRMGASVQALSVPSWIGKRFESKSLQLSFGVVSLAMISYAVLIVVAISHVLHMLLGLEAWVLALALIVFVFGYVMLGGVNTHAYTNAIQASIMVVVALLLLGNGLPSLWEGEGLFASLAAQDPVLVQVTNPASLYFRNLFEVFGCNFLVGLALVCQPHILSKSLYLKNDSQVRRFLWVATGTGLVFMMVMWVGLFARLELPAGTTIDQVVPAFIASHFSAGLQVLISVGVLCAGISTLEGILLALSTIISSDLYLAIFGRRLEAARGAEGAGRSALKVGRWSIVGLGAVTFALSRWQLTNPTGGSVAIFAQYGIYLLVSASFVPLAAGMFMPRATKGAVWAGALSSVAAYLLTALTAWSSMANNPAFLATVGLAAGGLAFGFVMLWPQFERIVMRKSVLSGTSLLVVMLAMSACGSEGPECRVGADCISGVCLSDGNCQLAEDGGEHDGGSDAGEEQDGASDGADEIADGATEEDGGQDAADAGGDEGPTACLPNHDGIIERREVGMAAGLRATFRVASGATWDTTGAIQADESRIWDMDVALAGDHAVLVELGDPVGTWFAPSFPAADYTSRLRDDEDLLGVFQVTEDALLLLGVVSPDEGLYRTELAYDPPVEVLRFPLQEGAAWFTESSVSGVALGVPSYYSEDYDCQVDAAGVLSTPYADFDVLRVRTVLSRTLGMSVSEIRSFAFVTECFGTVATLAGPESYLPDGEVEFSDLAELRRLAP